MRSACCSVIVGLLGACGMAEDVDPASVQLGDVDGTPTLTKAVFGAQGVARALSDVGDAATSTSTASTPPPFAYHGGAVLLGTTNVYLIWYGNWTGNTATTILPALATSLNGSPYFNINTTYTNAAKGHVTNAVHLAGQVTDSYSRGKALGDYDIATIVTTQIANKKLAKDSNALYVVLTSADVNETSGFCTAYCGWHTAAGYAGSTIQLAFVGNADRCPSACSAQATSPNGNPGADAMASVFAHELSETVSDPHLDAWYDKNGWENADKCAWNFGTTYAVANHSRANVKLGGKDYLLQQNWVNVGAGSCVLSH